MGFFVEGERKMRKLLMIGIVAGSIFGLLLKGIEQFTHKKVYTFLLNIDYFPVIGNWKINEFTEFSLHLFVSVMVVFVLYYGLKRFKYEKRITAYIWSNLIVGVLLFPTTTFSVRTPAFTDVMALLYWLGGHAVFGALVGIMIYFWVKKDLLSEQYGR